MSKILVIQVGIMILISGTLGGMLLYSDIYEDVYSKIVSVLCLSCLKLNPKTHLNFTFETANDEPHPDFVLDNLTKGPVFLHYRDDVCPGCDEMEPIMKEIFGVNYSMEERFYKMVKFDNSNITFIHINLDHTDKEKRNSFFIYDKDHIGGVPMFAIVTLGYDRNFVKPYYTTGYGYLEKDTPEEAKEILIKVIKDAINIYDQNREGYKP